MASHAGSLKIRQLLLGDLENFTYIIGDKVSGETFIIDPSGPRADVMGEITKAGLVLKAVILTHGHYDHIVDIGLYDVPVYLSRFESKLYTPGARELLPTEDGTVLRLGSVEVKCIHTPGHTPGCQCFLVESNLFTGDVLFMDAVGRTDFPGGNSAVLFDSLQKIKALPDATMIWPGHNYGRGQHATLGSLKKTNPFLVCTDVRQFCGYLG